MIFATILLFKCFDCTIKIMPNVFTRRSSHDFHLLPRHNPLWHLFFFFFFTIAVLWPDIYSNYVLYFCFSMSVSFFSFLWSDLDLQERCLISLLSSSLLYCTSKTFQTTFMGPCSNWAHKHLCLCCLAVLLSNFVCAICLRQEQIHFIVSSVLAHIIKAFYSCMTPPDKKNDSVPCSPVIIPLPSKRGRKKKESLTLVGSPTGTDPLILGLSGQVWQSCI